MYAFLDGVDADDFEAIAAQAYVEMLKAGYTSVAEFHYVHHDPRGNAYADPAELSRRVVAAASAARASGSRCCRSSMRTRDSAERRPPPASDGSCTRSTVMRGSSRRSPAICRRPRCDLGVAAHSLRAVTPDELAAVVALAPAGAPIHIHAAEQTKEVAECLAWSGARPIEWLLEHAGVDARWCVVHATHMTDRGNAPARRQRRGRGARADDRGGSRRRHVPRARVSRRAAAASASAAIRTRVIDPFGELRQLEWSQRLARQARNVLAAEGAPVGQTLHAGAARGGAQALARRAGAIAPGCRADFVVLDADDPALAGQPAEALLDAAVFGPCRRPVRDVMVDGRWVVRDGRHPQQDAVLARYRNTLARLTR